jgi:hypothetical protein
MDTVPHHVSPNRRSPNQQTEPIEIGLQHWFQATVRDVAVASRDLSDS